MNVIRQNPLHDKTEMITLCAVAIMIFCIIVHLRHSHVKHASCALNILVNARKVGKP